MKRNLISRIMLIVAALVLLALPAAALDRFDPVIEHGSDIWQTRGDGTTLVSFKNEPLPADFFCSGTPPFTGGAILRGVPLATSPAGALGPTDTIVQRLDDAVFDENGVAVTRLQVAAIQLESVAPLRTACGAYTVRMSLDDGEQPFGEMRIVRQGPDFGYYESTVALNFKMTFTPVDRQGPELVLRRSIEFPPNRNFWASQPGEGGVQLEGFVSVDTDANGEADTFIPGTSRNFAPGWFGNRDRDGILNRAADSEASGTLLGAPGQPALVTPQQALRSSGAALTSTYKEPTLTSAELDPDATTCGLCHCESYATHCQSATVEPVATTVN